MVTGPFGRNGQLVPRHVKQVVELECEIATILFLCTEEITVPASKMSTTNVTRVADIRSLEYAMMYLVQVCTFLKYCISLSLISKMKKIIYPPRIQCRA